MVTAVVCQPVHPEQATQDDEQPTEPQCVTHWTAGLGPEAHRAKCRHRRQCSSPLVNRRSDSIRAPRSGTHAYVFGVEDCLLDQFGDVAVIEVIDDVASLALSLDKTQVSQQSQLV